MKIRDEVKRLKPYDPGEIEAPVKLNKNESPFPLPEGLKKEILSDLAKLSFNRYPEATGASLREKLADFHGLEQENVIVGSGSDQLISYSVQLFSGEQVITTPPTFSMYRFYSEVNGLKINPVPLGSDFGLRPEEIKDNMEDTAAVFLCSPNNPTGNLIDRAEIVEILNTGVALVLDEAYGEFAGESNMDLIQEYDNLLVLRTFSKAFGLAGTRVGYALGQKSLIDYMLRVKPPYNLNSISLRMAEIILENYETVRERVEFIVDERERIYRNFEEICYPSRANFLLLDIAAGDFFRERGVAVRTFTGRLADKIRITVGTREENNRVIELLEEYREERA